MKKQVSLLLVVLMLFNVMTVLANNEEIFEVDLSWELEEIGENEIHEEHFPYEITEMDVPEGMEYLGYDLETGIHSFKALKDLTNVKGYMYYKEVVKEDLEQEEEGESNSVGKPSEGEGGEIEWGGFQLGKHDWDPEENLKHYAIRIDMEKYQNQDYIILQDTASENLNLTSDITVSMLHPDENNKVQNLGVISFEELDHEGQGFTIKIPVEKGILAYDVVYFMSHDGQPVSNKYKVFTVKDYKEIISSGNVSGEDKPIEDTPEEPVEEPVEEPEEPIEKPIEEPIEKEPEQPTEEPTNEPEELEDEDKEVEDIEHEIPGNPEPKEDIEKEDEIEEVEEEIIENDNIEENHEVEDEIIEDDDIEEEVDQEEVNDNEEIVELLPKTGISDAMNIVTNLGVILIIIGVAVFLKK